MNHRQMSSIVNSLRRLKCGMETKESIQIECRPEISSFWARNCNGGPHIVIALLSKRNDDVQAIGSSTLEYRDQYLSISSRTGENQALQKRRNCSNSNKSQPTVF